MISVVTFVTMLRVIPVLLAVVAAELLARWWLHWRHRYYVWAPFYRHESRLDPSVFPTFPSPARVIVNSEGERGCEPPRNARKLFRVLVAGGSAGECFVIDQEATWPLILQRILERPENLTKLHASHVHVGNIARSGISAEGMEFVLRMVAPHLPGVDLMIIMVGGTDVFHWLQAGAPAVPVQEITPDINMLNFFAWHPDGPYTWSPRHTAIAEIVRRLRQVILRPVHHSTHVGRGLIRAREQRANAAQVRRDVRNHEVLVDNFDRHLRKALSTAHSKAARVIVAPQPWAPKTEANKEVWENLWHGAVRGSLHQEVEAYYSTEVMSQLMSEISERAARVARSAGAECIEWQAAMKVDGNFYYDLIHFTPSGCAAVAKIIAAAVLDGPWAMEGQRGGESLEAH
jgi:hypothetical protein